MAELHSIQGGRRDDTTTQQVCESCDHRLFQWHRSDTNHLVNILVCGACGEPYGLIEADDDQ